MKQFSRDIPAKDFEKGTSVTTLTYLEARERSSQVPNDRRRATFKAGHQAEKARIIEALHKRIFFVRNNIGYPIKILMPDRYEIQVGYRHLFFDYDWEDLPKPGSLYGVDWPPESVEALLCADGSERCVGCEMRSHKMEDVWTQAYAMKLKENDMAKFVVKDGTTKTGRMLRNVPPKEVIVVAQDDDLSEEEEEVPWLALVVPRKLTPEILASRGPIQNTAPQSFPTPVSGKARSKGPIPAPEPPNPFCACRLQKWHKYLQNWHEQFELRKTEVDSTTNTSSTTLNASNEAVGLFALQYIPGGRPIGEHIGVLKPDLSYYPPDARWVRERTLSPQPSPSQAQIDRYRVDIPIGILPLADTDNDKMDIDGASEEVPDLSRAVTCTIDNYAYGNFTRFIRHSCNPNVERHTSRYGGVRMDVYFTRRPIYPGDEITDDFGLGYLQVAGGCKCGAENCQLPSGGEISTTS